MAQCQVTSDYVTRNSNIQQCVIVCCFIFSLLLFSNQKRMHSWGYQKMLIIRVSSHFGTTSDILWHDINYLHPVNMKQHLVMFLAYVHRPTSSDLLFNYLEIYQALRAATAHTSLCSTASDSWLGLSCSFDWAGGLQRVFTRNSCLMHLETALLRVKGNTKGVDLKTQVVTTYVVLNPPWT